MFLVVQRIQGDQSANQVRSGLHKHGGSINAIVEVERHISLRDGAGVDPPEHLPPSIDAAFREGATCLSVECPNAAAAMFRLCIDHATSALLPEEDSDGLNAKTRRSLGLRLEWLFKTGRLSPALRDLSSAIKEDGNDGAHEGTLTKDDAEDLLDFTIALLERLYTEPKRIELAQARRHARRNPTDDT